MRPLASMVGDPVLSAGRRIKRRVLDRLTLASHAGWLIKHCADSARTCQPCFPEKSVHMNCFECWWTGQDRKKASMRHFGLKLLSDDFKKPQLHIVMLQSIKLLPNPIQRALHSQTTSVNMPHVHVACVRRTASGLHLPSADTQPTGRKDSPSVWPPHEHRKHAAARDARVLPGQSRVPGASSRVAHGLQR